MSMMNLIGVYHKLNWKDPKKIEKKSLSPTHIVATSSMCITYITQYYIVEGFLKFITTKGGGQRRQWWFVVICLLPAIRKVIKTISRDLDSFHYLSLTFFFFYTPSTPCRTIIFPPLAADSYPRLTNCNNVGTRRCESCYSKVRFLRTVKNR